MTPERHQDRVCLSDAEWFWDRLLDRARTGRDNRDELAHYRVPDRPTISEDVVTQRDAQGRVMRILRRTG